jgi:transposase
MDTIVVERACGLDVHKEQVTACVLVSEGARARKQVKVFSTFTGELLALAEWLRSSGVTHVAMESTGVYWKPVYAVLEAAGGFDLVVGNAQHMKNVPGRKTDVQDAEWIAKLLRFGLIRKSYVPPANLRDLRDLVRYRRAIVQARSAERGWRCCARWPPARRTHASSHRSPRACCARRSGSLRQRSTDGCVTTIGTC